MDIFSYLVNQDSFREIEPPCGYKGGKRRFSAPILKKITQRHPSPTQFYDLCCGSGAVFLRALEWGIVEPKQVTCVDAGFWGVFWEAVAQGTLDVDLIEDLLLNQRPDDPRKVGDWLRDDVATRDPTPETFVVLQSSAWGGNAVWWNEDTQEWMQGEGSRKFSPRTYWEPGRDSPETKPRFTIYQPDSIVARVRKITSAIGGSGLLAYQGRVEDVTPKHGVLYLDPPYQNTSGYGVGLDLATAIDQFRDFPLYVSEGCPLPGAHESWKLSSSRKRASFNGNQSGDRPGNDEWLSFFLPK